ncbi:MAG: hypothetical protein ABIG93_03435 [archaeon]
MSTNKKKRLFIVKVFILVFSLSISIIALSSSVFALNASLVDSSEDMSTLQYVDSADAYKDSAPNSDLALLICDPPSNQPYVGISYALNISGTMNYTVINQRAGSSTYSLVQASQVATTCTGNKTQVSPFIVSSSHIDSSTPEAFVAAFPGRLWALVSSNENGAGTNFVFMNYSNGWLNGSYNSVGATFNQSTRNVTVSASSITFQGVSGNKNFNDGDYGLSNNRRLMVGVCADNYGANCSDGRQLNSSGATLSETFSSGLSAATVNDLNQHIRYVVINGLGTQFCIGPQLEVSSVTVNSSLLAGQPATVTVTVENNGDVNVTTDFAVTTVEEKGAPIRTADVTTVTTDLAANGGSTSFNFQITPASGSGNYNYTATINDTEAGITTCGTAHDSGYDTVSVAAVAQPLIWIDGILNGNFTLPGQFYNLTVQMNDSDSNVASYFANWTLRIYEKGGYNMVGPLQYNNDTNGFSGVFSVSEARVLMDNNGSANVTVAPTGNLALQTLDGNSNNQYSSNFENYSLVFKVYDDSGTEQPVSYKGTIYSCTSSDCEAPFTFTNSSTFNLYTNISATNSLFHNVSTYNADEVENVWNRLRQIALSITKILKT